MVENRGIIESSSLYLSQSRNQAVNRGIGGKSESRNQQQALLLSSPYFAFSGQGIPNSISENQGLFPPFVFSTSVMCMIVKEIPTNRQTLMYIATWPKEVRKIVVDLLDKPVQVNIGRIDELVANKSITQRRRKYLHMLVEDAIMKEDEDAGIRARRPHRCYAYDWPS
ncbi:hypothetical protein GIB67_009886 [Kingdonia uniflora]|uniref:Uncharacterized protein n=1 Tax=Kingdonia uniflora TaxID=39325 RepID=A0A7J7L7Y1_9MAGN|nr:hypothetical protein GIB67_009886 [Kingdonia uniflora]